MKFASRLITPLAIALGAGLWLSAQRQLQAKQAFAFTPNPLGIKQSPYGAVLAMSLQGSLDIDWHALEGGHDPDDHCEDCEEQEAIQRTEDKYRSPVGNIVARAQKSVDRRTNPHPPNQLLKFYLYREMGDKLRFAYELDPSHYANYNIYNLFLTINKFNTRHATEQDVLRLADHTIRYCLNEPSDPRPALTAASAATNALVITLRQDPNQPVYPLEIAKRYFALLDQALQRHETLLDQWQTDGTWMKLSATRRQEAEEHYQFNNRVRSDTRTLLTRLSSNPHAALSQP